MTDNWPQNAPDDSMCIHCILQLCKPEQTVSYPCIWIQPGDLRCAHCKVDTSHKSCRVVPSSHPLRTWVDGLQAWIKVPDSTPLKNQRIAEYQAVIRAALAKLNSKECNSGGNWKALPKKRGPQDSDGTYDKGRTLARLQELTTRYLRPIFDEAAADSIAAPPFVPAAPGTPAPGTSAVVDSSPSRSALRPSPPAADNTHTVNSKEGIQSTDSGSNETNMNRSGHKRKMGKAINPTGEYQDDEEDSDDTLPDNNIPAQDSHRPKRGRTSQLLPGSDETIDVPLDQMNLQNIGAVPIKGTFQRPKPPVSHSNSSQPKQTSTNNNTRKTSTSSSVPKLSISQTQRRPSNKTLKHSKTSASHTTTPNQPLISTTVPGLKAMFDRWKKPPNDETLARVREEQDAWKNMPFPGSIYIQHDTNYYLVARHYYWSNDNFYKHYPAWWEGQYPFDYRFKEGCYGHSKPPV